jgi:DNA-nicking Smr family endonuclease
MAAKKDDPQHDAPFNNPFTADLRKLKRRVRDAQRRKRATEPRVRDEAKPNDSPMSDEEAFRLAVSGAVPVRARGREVTHTGGANDSVKIRVRNSIGDMLLSDEHFDVRFSDQYIRGRCDGVSRSTIEKLEKGEFAVRSHVDLHGMAFDDASQTVDKFLADCQRRGERCVLVITGKGRNSPGQIGVLRERIPEWLSRGPSSRRVLAFVTARPCDGGEGALYVLLRKQAGRKARIDVESGGGA